MGMVWMVAVATDEEVASLRSNPSAIYDFVNSEEAYKKGRSFEVDKEWHAVHFLLTGSADATSDPLSFIIGDFEEMGPDNGYGPAWFIPKDAFTKFGAALALISDAELIERYDADAMVREEVYLADTLQEEGEEGVEFVIEDIVRLREFAAKAATGNLNAFGLIT